MFYLSVYFSTSREAPRPFFSDASISASGVASTSPASHSPRLKDLVRRPRMSALDAIRPVCGDAIDQDVADAASNASIDALDLLDQELGRKLETPLDERGEIVLAQRQSFPRLAALFPFALPFRWMFQAQTNLHLRSRLSNWYDSRLPMRSERWPRPVPVLVPRRPWPSPARLDRGRVCACCG